MDDLERNLRDAMSDIRDWEPETEGRFSEVGALAHHRAVRRRVLVSTALTAAVLLIGGSVLVAAQPGGQRVTAGDHSETTTSTTSTTPPSPESSTTLPAASPPPTESTTTTRPLRSATTSTTVAPVAQQTDAPDATVSSSSSSVTASKAIGCWQSGGDSGTACYNYPATWADDAPVLAVKRGETVTVTWTIDEQPVVESASVRRENETQSQAVTCSGSNPCHYVVDLTPGTYVFAVSTRWSQGTVTHAVRLSVS